MRLVHRNQRKTDPLAQGLQARCLQAFRCDIEQLVLALRGLPQNARALFNRLSTGQTSRRNTCLTQRRTWSRMSEIKGEMTNASPGRMSAGI